ncbi:cAMP-regulated D2 protein-like [Saccoglossus kowalevskii]|uniref:Carboxylic ester hydrolase n=1 Tax=Saccoglossus kowalevskii TaxID=10224 RepID=A0ABM0H198_SACKO|nr:PREDICTED: cAMP-regulated D2 protein-like [Saccoglossus kowalevskii]
MSPWNFAAVVLWLVICASTGSSGNENHMTSHQADGPIVETKYGKVQGVFLDGAKVFYGIPFAEPPTGDNRWRNPTPPKSWSPDILQATKIPPACPQHCALPPLMCANETSEDCLLMTVHAPLTSTHLSNLPVMAYIYGGRYIMGSGYNLLQDGRYLVNHSNIILVEFNYRIGALGFLVAGKGKDAATGNYAIHDQRLALQWIQDNIVAFGGNPDSVTIFGQSSGAESVSIHLISEKSEHLFHRAIIESHPFALPYRVHADAIILGNKLAKVLNCSTADMSCLRSKSYEEILDAQEKVGGEIVNPFRLLELFQPWGPWVGSDDVPEQPVDAFYYGLFSHKPIMIGSTSDEGRANVFLAYKKPISKSQYYETIIADFRLRALDVLYRYPPTKLESDDQREVLSIVAHQYMFVCPEQVSARGISKYSDTWLYVFDHAISFDAWGPNYHCCVNHPCHGSELPFIFHSPSLAGFNFTIEEESLSRSLMYYWTNFARTGDPNNSGSECMPLKRDGFTKWPKYDKSKNWQYLRFMTPQNVVMENYLSKECNFWDSLNYYP